MSVSTLIMRQPSLLLLLALAHTACCQHQPPTKQQVSLLKIVIHRWRFLVNLKSEQFVYIQVVAGLRRSLVSSVPAARQQHVVGDYLSTEQITLLQHQLHNSDIMKTEKVSV